jgi:hypothetical protein
MKHIVFSLINNDYQVENKTGFDLHDDQCEVMSNFFNQISEKLATGQEGHLEIKGIQQKTLFFTVTSEELLSSGL